MLPPWLTVVLLGLIEGVTEFLPISSTGHLLLAEAYLSPQGDLFNTVIQSGAVLAVLVVFAGRLRALWASRATAASRAYVGALAVAFAITGVGGLALKAAHLKLPERVTPVALATLLGGVLFVLGEALLTRRGQRLERPITLSVAVGMGLAQLLAAVFPGTSRSGATILWALAMGVGRPAAAEFSFLLGVPTLLSAGALQAISHLRGHDLQPVAWPSIALGAAVAAVTALASVRWLLRYVRHHSFAGFGWYRIALGLAMLARGG